MKLAAKSFHPAKTCCPFILSFRLKSVIHYKNPEGAPSLTVCGITVDRNHLDLKGYQIQDLQYILTSNQKGSEKVLRPRLNTQNSCLRKQILIQVYYL